MAFNTYNNPFDVVMDGNSLTGVVAVTIGVSAAEVHAAADDDAHESVARGATKRVSGSISFVDPTQAAAARGLNGTLVFKINEVKGGTDKTYTTANVATGGSTSNVARDAASGGTIPFIAEALPVIS